MRRLRKRDIFAHIGEILLTPSQKHLAKDGGVKAKADLLEIIYAQSPPGGECEITEKDVICVVVKMGYGKGGKNPVMVSLTSGIVLLMTALIKLISKLTIVSL